MFYVNSIPPHLSQQSQPGIFLIIFSHIL